MPIHPSGLASPCSACWTSRIPRPRPTSGTPAPRAVVADSTGPTGQDGLTMDLSGSTILLTGGTGSFGQAFIEQVSASWPDATIRVFSRDELKQSELQARHE